MKFGVVFADLSWFWMVYNHYFTLKIEHSTGHFSYQHDIDAIQRTNLLQRYSCYSSFYIYQNLQYIYVFKATTKNSFFDEHE